MALDYGNSGGGRAAGGDKKNRVGVYSLLWVLQDLYDQPYVPDGPRKDICASETRFPTVPSIMWAHGYY